MGRPRQWPPQPHPHRPSGQERIRWKGKDHYLGPIGSLEAKKAYIALIERLEQEGQDAPPKPPPRDGDWSVAEVVAWFLEDADARYGPESSEPRQHACSAQPLMDLFGDLPAARFGVNQLEEVREEMIRRGLCRSVINRRIVRIKTLFRRAEVRGKVPAGTWSALRTLEPMSRTDTRIKNSPPRKEVSKTDLDAVCEKASPLVRDLLLVLWWTGARPGEIVRLRAGDIDRSGEVWTARLQRHKNAWRGQTRIVTFGPRAQAVLAPRLAGLQPGDYVFSRRPPAHYSVTSFTSAVARACKRAGVKLIGYQMRHSAKARITRELGLDFARAALGQACLSTADRYAAGQDMKLASEAAKRCG